MQVKRRIPDVLFGALLAVAIFAMGFLAGSSPQSLTASKSQGSEKGEKERSDNNPLVQFWDWTTHDAVSFYTFVLVILTGVLAGVGWIQTKQTRILQRAYVGVEPDGIRTSSHGDLIGHVVFRNVGHLPAKSLSWALLPIQPSNDPAWRLPVIPPGLFEGNNVVPIGTRMKKGSAGLRQIEIDRLCSLGTVYLYVYGRVEYLDGFDQQRFMNFCHRYNWDVRYIPSGGGTAIDADNARYHEHGNDGD
jgi:hypothetical protein